MQCWSKNLLGQMKLVTQSMLFHLETFNEAASNFGQEVKLGEVVLESSAKSRHGALLPIENSE